MEKIKSTTVLAIKHNGKVAIGADGQATLGNTVAKSNVKKIRKLADGKIVTGFAGSTADAFTLLDRFDEKLSNYSGNLKRAAVELAKDWRTDRYLRKLEAMMIVADKGEVLIVSGTGDVIEPDEEELVLPKVTFSSVINLPSSDFQKIIRDLSNISERLEIKSVGSELIFKCQGPFAMCEIRRSESDGVMEFITKTDDNKVIQGEFLLKNLGYFIKCTNLCNSIEMYLENDLPLIVKYAVASLGEIKLCLAPLPS